MQRKYWAVAAYVSNISASLLPPSPKILIQYSCCSFVFNNSGWTSLHHVHTEPQGVQDGTVREGEFHGTPVGDKRWLPFSAGHGLGQQRDWIHASSERLVSLSLCTQTDRSLHSLFTFKLHVARYRRTTTESFLMCKLCISLLIATSFCHFICVSTIHFRS